MRAWTQFARGAQKGLPSAEDAITRYYMALLQQRKEQELREYKEAQLLKTRRYEEAQRQKEIQEKLQQALAQLAVPTTQATMPPLQIRGGPQIAPAQTFPVEMGGLLGDLARAYQRRREENIAREKEKATTAHERRIEIEKTKAGLKPEKPDYTPQELDELRTNTSTKIFNANKSIFQAQKRESSIFQVTGEFSWELRKEAPEKERTNFIKKIEAYKQEIIRNANDVFARYGQTLYTEDIKNPLGL